MCNHYHIRFDTNLGNGICEICGIPCASVACTSMIDQPCISDVRYKKQARCQPVINYTYWKVPGSYNNWNIIHLTPKSTPSEAFDEINQVVLDGIIENMTSYGFYVIPFISDAYTLQSNNKIYEIFISSGDLVVKSQYLCSVHENTNWYWKQQPLQQTIILPTRIIRH